MYVRVYVCYPLLMEKACTKCGVVKDLELGFARRARATDGRQSWCRSCNTTVRTAWARANPDRIQRHTRYSRRRMRQEEFEAMMVKQSGKCAICEIEFSATVQFVIDHDHSCCDGKISCGKCTRGLLCTRCNLYVGFIETTSPKLFERTKEYLALLM